MLVRHKGYKPFVYGSPIRSFNTSFKCEGKLCFLKSFKRLMRKVKSTKMSEIKVK